MMENKHLADKVRRPETKEILDLIDEWKNHLEKGSGFMERKWQNHKDVIIYFINDLIRLFDHYEKDEELGVDVLKNEVRDNKSPSQTPIGYFSDNNFDIIHIEKLKQGGEE